MEIRVNLSMSVSRSEAIISTITATSKLSLMNQPPQNYTT
jgi:hypothetical protein